MATDLGGSQTVLSNATYLPFGPLSGFTFGNGIVVDRSHDQQYRLDELESAGVEDLSYTYDAAGNIDAITDNLDSSFSRAFAQDALDRITSDQGVFGTRTYQYDSVGNRTGRWLDGSPEQAITVVSNSNRLATINSVSVTYDAAGNVLADGSGRTFAYNDLNRMSSAADGGQTVATFAYNAFGQRARKTETASSESTVFAFGPDGKLLSERLLRSDGTRELEREYLWLESMPVAMAERIYASNGTTVTAGQFVYLHADHIDTPRLATNASQDVVWRWRSDAFGVGAAELDPDADSVDTDLLLRFPGQYFDRELESNYNYFRDYDSAMGRYVQSDPIGLDGGLNTYAYVGNDPLTFVDDNGLEPRRRGGNRGERGRTHSPDGTPSPSKHVRPHPTDPGKVIVTDPHTGKSHERPRKDGDPPPKTPPAAKSEMCGDDCTQIAADVLVVAGTAGTAYFVYRCARMAPSLLPPFWWTIPANAAMP